VSALLVAWEEALVWTMARARGLSFSRPLEPQGCRDGVLVVLFSVSGKLPFMS
jgi:hypothetical protein